MQAATEDKQSTQPENGSRQFLTFRLGDEIYGVDILRVREIRAWSDVRDIPNTPDYISGVLNLRGVIVPIVDLRVRFRMPTVEFTATTVTIVIALIDESGVEHTLGMVVDAVSDVLDSESADLQSAPNMGSRVDTRFIESLVVADGDMVVLLSADTLLDVEELNLIETLEQQS